MFLHILFAAGGKEEGAAESGSDAEGEGSDDDSYDREAAGGGPQGEGEESSDQDEEEMEEDGSTGRQNGTTEDEGAIMRKVLQGVMQGKGAETEPEGGEGVAVMEDEQGEGARGSQGGCGASEQDARILSSFCSSQARILDRHGVKWRSAYICALLLGPLLLKERDFDTFRSSFGYQG